jgi:hypothetical protein
VTITLISQHCQVTGFCKKKKMSKKKNNFILRELLKKTISGQMLERDFFQALIFSGSNPSLM